MDIMNVFDVNGMLFVVYDGLVLKERHPSRFLALGLNVAALGDDAGIMLFAEISGDRRPAGPRVMGLDGGSIPRPEAAIALYGINPGAAPGMPIEHGIVWEQKERGWFRFNMHPELKRLFDLHMLSISKPTRTEVEKGEPLFIIDC